MRGVRALPSESGRTACPSGFLFLKRGRRAGWALHAAAAWHGTEPLTAPLPLGLFGASTGAAAALRLTADSGSGIADVVSRGGRPDLAGNALDQVMAPTLLTVGGADEAVLNLNRQALGALGGPKALEVIPGATHLFEEPGALEQVAGLATNWFVHHFEL